MDPKNTLCNLRWNAPTIDIEEGVVRTCCRVPRMELSAEDLKRLGPDAILNSPYLLERRAEMFAGQQHPDCHVCWAAESQGARSPRGGAYEMQTRYEFQTGEVLPADGVKISIDNPILRSDNPRFVELQLGIICDLKCIYCWRGNSSSWLSEDYRHGDITKEQYEKLSQRVRPDFAPVFWDWFNKVAATIQMVSFVGGEPTLSANFIPTIESVLKILKAKKSKASLRIVTNLNCNEQRMQLFLNSLKPNRKTQILIDVSMESVGRKAEFIRSGLKWPQFAKNFDLLSRFASENQNVLLSISSTLNALSVFSIADFIEFLHLFRNRDRQRLGLLRNTVIEPRWLSPQALTPEFVPKIKVHAQNIRKFHQLSTEPATSDFAKYWSLGWNDYANYLDGVADSLLNDFPGRDDLQVEFYENIKKLEMRRKVSFSEVFPEFTDFFHFCETKWVARRA